MRNVDFLKQGRKNNLWKNGKKLSKITFMAFGKSEIKRIL